MSIATTQLNAILSFLLDYPVIAQGTMEPATIWTVIASIIGTLTTGVGALWGFFKIKDKRAAARDKQEREMNRRTREMLETAVSKQLEAAREDAKFYRESTLTALKENTDSNNHLKSATVEQTAVLTQLCNRVETVALNQSEQTRSIGTLTNATQDVASTLGQLKCVVMTTTDQGGRDTKQ